ncbi:MAG: NAD(P)H-dependent oxidoreductase [Bermanella sp.]
MSNSTTTKNILIIKSSTAADYSVSSEIADFLMNQLQEKNGSEIQYKFTIRDLAKSPAPFLNNETVGAFYTPPEALSAEQVALVAPSQEYITELQNADIVVIASAMHNFSITSLLKAYIDQICRVGLTFQYSSAGPEGLLKNKQAILITSSGMDFKEEYAKSMDFQTPYLRRILSFIGIEDIRHIPVQGLANEELVPSIKDAAKQEAKELALDQL